MDISTNISATAAQGANDAVAVAMMKKAMAINAQSVMTLINSVPQPVQTPSNLPPNLGQNINVTA
ncbi:MAG: putative motility protein [Sideroxydans sp.]|nr:putative motility protein [Sideroxydans sp.]